MVAPVAIRALDALAILLLIGGGVALLAALWSLGGRADLRALFLFGIGALALRASTQALRRGRAE